MVIKQIPILIDRHFCDFCKRMEDGTKIHMNTCVICGKDACNWCIQEIDITSFNLDYDSIYVCPDCKHKDLDYLVNTYQQEGVD